MPITIKEIQAMMRKDLPDSKIKTRAHEESLQLKQEVMKLSDNDVTTAEQDSLIAKWRESQKINAACHIPGFFSLPEKMQNNISRGF